MFEIARNLEQIAVQFNPAVLIWPGLAAVLLGLFVWLGGLGFKMTSVAIAGGVGGGICGFFIFGSNIMPAIASAVIAGFLSIIFERIFTAILTGAMVAILSFAILAGLHIVSGESSKSYPEYEVETTKRLNIQQSIGVAKAYIADFVTETKRIRSQIPRRKQAIIAVLGLVFMAAGFFQQRLSSAFCCAALGAMLIFAGMILLLLYKGAAPISKICQNQLFYLGTFGVMTIFGTAEQFLLCPYIKRVRAKKKGSEEPTENWRGR